MKTMSLIVIALMMSLQVQAFSVIEEIDISTQNTRVFLIFGTVSGTSSGIRLYKQLEAAKDDLVYFVGTKGEVRTANAERAFQIVREMIPNLQATDEQIALEILANFDQ
ncbi:DUF2388 domain-containing protein [Bdellovibrio sp. HCB2-146]|uniref:DUF2388 domain-containing protein n=1 Tax=Bdellovibrio sp. HCB2-146 TaxID=3394362 RepID=UPI0039BD6899